MQASLTATNLCPLVHTKKYKHATYTSFFFLYLFCYQITSHVTFIIFLSSLLLSLRVSIQQSPYLIIGYCCHNNVSIILKWKRNFTVLQSVPLYLSEMAPTRYRGAINNGFQLCVG